MNEFFSPIFGLHKDKSPSSLGDALDWAPQSPLQATEEPSSVQGKGEASAETGLPGPAVGSAQSPSEAS